VARARGEDIGPLGGLPVIVKDNIDTMGFPTSCATNSLRGLFPQSESAVTASLWRNGALLFAKANMHEMAGGGTSSNPAFGFVRNPHDPARTPGGSSGGTAAALAARMVPAGLGSDTAGSVRIPSSFCGTAALRPTIGGSRRYGYQGLVPLARDLDTIGPMARSVDDVALLHEAITGEQVPSVTLSNVRIGVPRGWHWDAIDADVETVAQAALCALEDAGAILVDIDVSALFAQVQVVFQILLSNGFKSDLARYFAEHALPCEAEDVVARIQSHDTRTLFEKARASELAPEMLEAARGRLRQAVQQDYAEMLREHGVAALVYPVEPLVAPLIPPLGDRFEDEVVVADKSVNKVDILIRNTGPTCALGVPGVCFPGGTTRTQLPVGIEFDGVAGRDGELLALGIAAERAIAPVLPPPTSRILQGLNRIKREAEERKY